jgi:hypothetical protein
MQAQAPRPPYVGLWTRLERFQPEALSQLLLDRSVVRIALMRGTVHLVTAGDCLALRPLVQPILDRATSASGQYRLDVASLDIEALTAAGRAVLEQQPLTPKELGNVLAGQWPDHDPASLAYAIRNLVPLVQVPPRGLWNAGGPTRHTTAESWLGRPLEADPSPDDMVRRYLTAFGPATINDAQAWSGLTRLGEVVDRLRPTLRTFRDEHDRELFDLPEAPRPDGDVPAPVRFLPEYDNLLLSHADRSRIVADEHRTRLMTRNGVIPGTVLIDGFVAATWKINRHKEHATLLVEPFRPLSKNATTAVRREGAQLLRFAAADEDHDIQLSPPT